MAKNLICTLVVVAALAAAPVLAVDYSNDSGSDTKESQDKSISIRNSKDKKDSTTVRKGKSTSTGRDKQQSTSDRESGTIGINDGLDVTLPAPLLFVGWQPPTPRLARDFGLSGDKGNGMINISFQEWLSQAARANKPVSEVTDEAAIRRYLLEVAETGAVLGQAQLYLQADSGKIGKLKRKEDGTVEVRELGQDDLLNLASGALKKAQKQITDTRIKLQLAKIKADQSPCRFAGEPSQIQCGQAVLTLGAPPVLKISGMPWYADTSFAGVSAIYKVGSSWSWSQALEEARSNSKFSKFASEASTAAEHLEAEGKVLEAAMSRRKAVEKMQASKQGLSAGKFAPSVH